MNRELIIIGICIIFVGFFYLQSDDTSSASSVEEAKQTIYVQDNSMDTTKAELPDSTGK